MKTVTYDHDGIYHDENGNPVNVTVVDGVAKDDQGNLVRIVVKQRTLSDALSEHPSIIAWTLAFGAVGYLVVRKTSLNDISYQPVRLGVYTGSIGTAAALGFIIGLVRGEGIK